MGFFQSIPFKRGFYAFMGIGMTVFIFTVLFKVTKSGFLMSFEHRVIGLDLIDGLKDVTTNKRIFGPQILILIVIGFALTSMILAFLKTKMKYTLISILGVLSSILLILQIERMGPFKTMPSYYLIIFMSLLGAMHAWAHKNKNNKAITTTAEKNNMRQK